MTLAPRLAPTPVPVLRPSEYTAALIDVLRRRASYISGKSALEIGSGSGVILATLGSLDATSLCGVDIEPMAIAASTQLMSALGFGTKVELLCGDLWDPVEGRQFDVVVANLPHFPMRDAGISGRLPTWSAGGADGRRLLDPFLQGLGRHLAPGGRAIITHNGFVGLDRSRAALASTGLGLRVADSGLVYVGDEKLALMTDIVRRTEEGRTLHRFGPYTFADLLIVEIGTPDVLG